MAVVPELRRVKKPTVFNRIGRLLPIATSRYGEFSIAAVFFGGNGPHLFIGQSVHFGRKILSPTEVSS